MISNDSMQVCVLGAGTMGSGIAAHLANCGFQVTLLDLTRESCQAAFDRAKALKPPHFFTPAVASRIRIGGIDQDLAWVSEADWVCEAIIEKLDAKRELYEKIEPLIRPDAMVSTNTSGLEISLLIEGRSKSFAERFMGTHFFNPPRYLKLLELIPTAQTSAAEIKRMTEFLETRCGRRVVPAKDTPGFIANRFGMWAMIHCVHVAEKLRLDIEAVDAMTGPFLGRPRSASFRLNDLVGIDIMADIAGNLSARCADDAFRPNLELPRSVRHLLETGHLGQKSGCGYFMKRDNGISALDLESLLYREPRDADLPSLAPIAKLPLGERIRQALTLGDDVGEFMRRHLIPVLQYAVAIREEVSHSPQDFDRVMMWGFGWEMGPFAMIDAIGAEHLGIDAGPFYRDGEMRANGGGWIQQRQEPEFRTLADYPVVEQHKTFAVRDLGEGVKAVCLGSKLGTFTVDLIRELTPWVAAQSGPFVVANTQRAFSVGFDLQFLLDAHAEGRSDDIEAGLVALQELSRLMGTKRSVAAVHGYCLGGGFEVAMGCAQVVAHPDAQIGFPEAKVGLIPSGSGVARMRCQHQGSAKELVEMAAHLVQGYTAGNAYEAKQMGYLRSNDIVLNHPDRLITAAREAALVVQPIAEPAFEVPPGPLTGMIEAKFRELMQQKKITEFDYTIGEHLNVVLTKCTSFGNAVDREREEFHKLLQKGQTIARIRHMLETGKPLRN